MSNRPARVYVAGPFTGDQMANIGNAIRAADAVLSIGCIPFLPHTMTGMWHLVSPKKYDTWIQIDLTWLRCCDILYVFGYQSDGVQLEIKEAESLGMPIVYSLPDLISFIELEEVHNALPD